MTKDSHLQSKFELTGISPAPRGISQIEETFDVDAKGILNVSALEKGCGKVEKITITNNKDQLSKKEIEKMVHEMKKFKTEEERHWEKVAVKNSLEACFFKMKASPEMKAKLTMAKVARAPWRVSSPGWKGIS